MTLDLEARSGKDRLLVKLRERLTAMKNAAIDDEAAVIGRAAHQGAEEAACSDGECGCNRSPEL